MKTLTAIACLSVLTAGAFGQYSREFQSSNLGTSGYGGSYEYDMDGDGVANLWTRSTSGQIVVYNSSLSAWWTVTFPGYSYSYITTPRDVDGDGLVVPVNMDGDGAGEVVFSGAEYTTDGYNGKIRVYDASSRSLEWESPVISGFNGFANVDDVDGDGKHEIIIFRSDYTSYGYVEVYGHVGAGIDGDAGYVLESSRELARPSVLREMTEIRFTLTRGGSATLTVFDEAGRQVRSLLDADVPEGGFSVRWDGKDDAGRTVPAGAYLYRLTAGEETRSGRLTVVR